MGDKEKQQEDDDGDDENASLASLVRKGKKAKAYRIVIDFGQVILLFCYVFEEI